MGTEFFFMSDNCELCKLRFSADYTSDTSPIWFSECNHVVCLKCSQWNSGGGAGSGIGHYKGKERGTAFCGICNKKRFKDPSDSDDSDAADIRFHYETIEKLKREL